MGPTAACITRALLGAILALLLVAGPAQAAPSVLFAVDADRGTLVPVAPKRGLYDLTLRGVSSPALFFENRPGNEQGLISVPLMFRRLFQDGQSAPNAVVNVVDRRGRQALMGVKLSPPRYDARRHVLRVRVKRLAQGAGATRTRGRTDVVLPRRFGDAAMFIDDCCARGSAAVSVFNPTSSTQTVQVNGGAQFSVVGTTSYDGFAPGAATSPPGYSPSGPDQGVLGPGNNVVRVFLPGGGVVTYLVGVPSGIAFVSLQLYLFTTPTGGTWIVANNGTLVAQGGASGVG